jgi:hypothetical protein
LGLSWLGSGHFLQSIFITKVAYLRSPSVSIAAGLVFTIGRVVIQRSSLLHDRRFMSDLNLGRAEFDRPLLLRAESLPGWQSSALLWSLIFLFSREHSISIRSVLPWSVGRRHKDLGDRWINEKPFAAGQTESENQHCDCSRSKSFPIIGQILQNKEFWGSC